MESQQSLPPPAAVIDFTLGDDSDDSDFYAVWDPTSPSTDPTDTMEVLEVVDLTDLTSEDTEPEVLPFYGPLLPPQGDGDAAGGPSRPDVGDVDAETESSFAYATSDSQGAPSPPSCSTCLTENPEVGVVGVEEDAKSRGLLIAAPHIERFFAKIMERKTHEVRNFYCRVVGKNEQIYLVQSGLKDANGKGVFCVRGKAEFRGNTFVPHEEFSKHYAKHRCSAAEYSSVRSSWVDKGGCVLWEFKLLDVFDQPLYFRPKQGEEIWTLFDMSKASTDPGLSCPVPVRQLEMETAPAASASSLVLVETRPNPTDIRKAFDEHCPRKATRANVQRESHYPCDPSHDLLYGDDDGDSLASALSDIIAEEYGSGPFKVERATQPSAALSADAAAALESHRVKTSLGRDRPEDRAPAAEPATIPTTTTSLMSEAVNSVNMQASDVDVSAGAGDRVRGDDHDDALDATMLLSTQAERATLPTLPQDDASQSSETMNLRASVPAGPPQEVQRDAEMPAPQCHEPSDVGVDETLLQKDVEMPEASTQNTFNVAQTLSMHSGPRGEIPMPAGPPTREVENAEPTLLQSEPGEQIPAVPAVPPQETQNDVDMLAAAATMWREEPADVGHIPRSVGPHSEVHKDVEFTRPNPHGSTPDPVRTAPAPSAATVATSLMPEAVPQRVTNCPTPARMRMQPSPSTSATVVTNLKEYFDFFPNAVDAVVADGTISPELLGEQLDRLSISTAYSGIGGPEAALFTLRHCFARQGHGVRLQSKGPHIIFQMEIDATCRGELLKYESLGGHSGQECCLFGDLEQFFRHELEDVVEQLRERPELALEVLSKAVADCDAAGCKQMGVRDATVLPFLVWICHRLLLQEPVIIHENSPRFPRTLLERFLGHLYVIDECIIESSDYGSPARRERKLTRMYHRVKVNLPDVPFASFNKTFHRSCTMTWREFYWQHLVTDDEKCKAEMVEDLLWASSRPTVRAAAASEGCEHERALNPSETKSLKAYRAKSPTMAYSLSQNGATSFGMTSTEHHLQTMIRHSGLTWCDGPLATGTGTEVLVTQAWPVHPILNAGMLVTPFHADVDSSGRTSRGLRAQAGNSMNLFMLAVQLLHTLCHVQVMTMMTPMTSVIATGCSQVKIKSVRLRLQSGFGEKALRPRAVAVARGPRSARPLEIERLSLTQS
ncbi:unnamed protein product [Symbiodinium necroappetens]|uniref:Uncharacterized protein n=1 Tax=Symbiodinium necroappetens TaxID=1628268 RepID=A0A812SAD5_9DINO|nr:unnamed protein product [Symbiodinium necroappetens]